MLEGAAYEEARDHELRKSRIVMVDGRVLENQCSSENGRCARVRIGGHWGQAAAPGDADRATLRDRARGHARTLARLGPRAAVPLPAAHALGQFGLASEAGLCTSVVLDRLQGLTARCRQSYPALTSLKLMAVEDRHVKRIHTSFGSDAVAILHRSVLMVTMATEDDEGRPIELTERVAVRGPLADLPLESGLFASRIDELHGHLQAKRHAVPVRAGEHVVVLAPRLTGILAHEAMGHPCEADAVRGGAVTGSLLGHQVASDEVTLIDVAHHHEGQEVLVPVYVDDEGVPAVDAVLIERGILMGYMHSRETAADMGRPPTGNARAWGAADAPLVRMRNTLILPGTRRAQELVDEVDDGYWLIDTNNGEADATTEFMFGVTMGYEIRHGRLGRAIRDTTVSGSALKVLRQVEGVANDLQWHSTGYCGKRQLMVVSEGGPSLRTRVRLGGR